MRGAPGQAPRALICSVTARHFASPALGFVRLPVNAIDNTADQQDCEYAPLDSCQRLWVPMRTSLCRFGSKFLQNSSRIGWMHITTFGYTHPHLSLAPLVSRHQTSLTLLLPQNQRWVGSFGHKGGRTLSYVPLHLDVGCGPLNFSWFL